MSRRFLPSLALMLALATLTSSCAELAWWLGGGAAATFVLPNSRVDPLYNRRYHGAGFAPIDPEDVRSPLVGYVEFDDFGWYRNRDQPRALLARLQEMTASENTVVVLYIHGWRHNCSEKDADQKSFRETLRMLNAQLDSDTFRTARRFLSGRPDARIVGVAVGWRGQAWPEMQRWLPGIGHLVDLPVYPTAFGRKQTAEIVGNTDLQDFVGTLADLHARRWQTLQKPGQAPMMSLVMVGHSFGGHALFDAVRERMERNLETAIVGAHLDSARGMADRVVPRAARLDPFGKNEPPPAPRPCRRVVESIGDLVVLINPAIEAASYKNVDALVRSATFPPRQPPVLLTISSTNDGARLRVFRWLQILKEAGRTFRWQQYRMETAALGSFADQHTNELDLADRSSTARAAARRPVKAAPPRPDGDRVIDPAVLRAALQQLDASDLSSAFSYDNVAMTRLVTGVEHSPALVVNTSSRVVNGHSGFFREQFIEWLGRYVLDIQMKRLIRIQEIKDFMAAGGAGGPAAGEPVEGEPGGP